MYDAIVVGARCAGSPTAMLLARRGYRVLVVDRATFPSDVPRAHFIQPNGVARLDRWGLLDRVRASGCPRVGNWSLDDGALAGTPPPADPGGVVGGYAPRRSVLDEILVRAAAEAGAEVTEGFTVEELLTDGERVTGIRGHTARGEALTARARIVIGADGMRSMVARAVGAPAYSTHPAVTCAYFSYWSGVPTEGLEIAYPHGREVIAVGTNDGLTLVYVAWPLAAFPAIRADVETAFMDAVDRVPGLAERVWAGERVEHWYGAADLPNFFRRSQGPGWALVGDAGYHRDPILAQGITDAFRDAELLSAAIDAGFGGRRPLADALADYERRRFAAAKPMYELNYTTALLRPPTDDQRRLRAALRGNQRETNRFFGVVAGTVPVEDFYNADNLARIVSAAPARVAVAVS
ncbi:MAG TPA: NAD(P)/FAD-dependent oxidoreductase [Candidatus Dormibacteraeota bacterium]|nr:NAD(P)/FAD-dependent oxidoreductase [Candidatus Dormibacteraeota bacterium]